MAGEKSYVTNTPDIGEQKAPTGIKGAFTEILAWINGIYANSGSVGNNGKFLKCNGDGTFSLATSNTGTVYPARPQAVLSLESGVPFSSSDRTGANAANLYYVPFAGGYLTLYTASAWTQYQLASQLTLAIPAETATMRSAFVYDNSGTVTLTSVAWTNDTTPGAAAIAYQNGVAVLSTDHSKLYVGDFRTTGVSGQVEISSSKQFLVNTYHQAPRDLWCADTTATWAYTTATIRAANANSTAGQGRFEFIVGQIPGPVLNVTNIGSIKRADTTAAVASSSLIGYDSTTVAHARSSGAVVVSGESASVVFATQPSQLVIKPAAGYHFVSRLEKGASNITMYGYSGDFLSAMQGVIHDRI